MKRFHIIALGLLILSAVLGFMRANSAANAGAVEAQDWQALPLPGEDTAGLSAVGARIRAADLFVLSEKAELERAKAGETAEAAEGAAPPFPAIGAVSAVNKTYRVTLIDAQGAVQTVAAGDTLENGWLIKSIDGQQVIAAYEDEERRVPVADYIDTAFDKPEGYKDEQQDSNGDVAPNVP